MKKLQMYAREAGEIGPFPFGGIRVGTAQAQAFWVNKHSRVPAYLLDAIRRGVSEFKQGW